MSLEQEENEPVANPLEILKFDFLYGLRLPGIGHIADVEESNGYTILGGYVNNDQVSGGENAPVFVTCSKSNHNPSIFFGEYSDTDYNCGNDGVIVILNPDGSIAWGSYVGGPYDDMITVITTDSESNIIIGGTGEEGLITESQFDNTTDTLGDGFIIKMRATGERLWASYLGGSYYDSVRSIVTDTQDNIIVSGFTKSKDFPLINPIDDQFDGSRLTTAEMFISKFHKNGSIIWSTYLGGSEYESDYSVGLDQDDNIVVTGLTKSGDFPFVEVQEENQGKIDVFLLKISPSGELLNAKLLGGFLSDIIIDSTLDKEGNLVMIGYSSSKDFPTVNAFDDSLNNDPDIKVYTDAIIVKMDPESNILWSTYLGGNGADRGVRLHITEENHIIVLGQTASLDFPYYTPYDIASGLNALTTYDSGDQPTDIFTSVFNPEGHLLCSFFIGGIANDYIQSSDYENGSVVFVGNTKSAETFPELNPPLTGGGDRFIGKFNIQGDYVPVRYFDLLNVEVDVEEENVGIELLDPFVLLVIAAVSFKPLKYVVDKIRARWSDQMKEQQREEIKEYLKKIGTSKQD